MGRPKIPKPTKEKKPAKKQVEPSTFEEFMEGMGHNCEIQRHVDHSQKAD
jgi:hypothetical protein